MREDFAPASSYAEAEIAKRNLAYATRRHRNVNGVGLSKDQRGWYVKVNLRKEHRWWHRKLPGGWFQDVRVRYQVIGEVVAA
ncbi:hypothetical protein MYRNA_20 [Mycobacterium phage Myrna]|uniref:Uncharacterized protein n=1 Tax=Mycobacterium phage Myrna TaxID=546805 RepID=B5LJ31_9CAUD|nr:gp20 [Mycobacterium phage Myrna]ACH62028.1 hypothetical protein MYRNA_20 [Mycobacterium phage Myrna]